MIKVKKHIRQLEAYHPPLDMRTERDYLLLDFNESTLPPDPNVIAAMREYVEQGQMRKYPAYGKFLSSLSAYTAVPEDHLIITNGSDSAIQLIMQALLGEGDEMILPSPGFSVIDLCARSQGARVLSPRYEGDQMAFPADGIRQAISPATRLVVIINPNNPTGTAPTLEQVESLLQAYPDVAFMVDEAYYEFSGFSVAGLISRFDNLIVIRTFSKAFAIAGLRLGYVLSNPEFIQDLYKIRIPYDVNAVAVIAAEALLKNQNPWRAYVEEVMSRAKPMVERFFDEHGVDYVKGAANFMLVRPDNVQAAFEYLKENGILVRPQRDSIADRFRMSVGTVEDMKTFMAVYARFLESGQKG